MDITRDALESTLGAITWEEGARDMSTFSVSSAALIASAQALRQHFDCHQLTDLTVVDYLHYGLSEWQTHASTATGFGRGRHPMTGSAAEQHRLEQTQPRFAVVYHLLSLTAKQRLRMKVTLQAEESIPSVTGVWPVANWYEREAFDMFGVVFTDHPDLRRLLTDYGFEGHPMRKDFPLSGHVELRYDAAAGQCLYEPVDIQPRITVPKVIRHDARYESTGEDSHD